MKKEEQQKINATIEEWTDFILSGKDYKVIHSERLRSKAEVWHIYDTRKGLVYYLLQSYGTPVALIVGGTCYDFLRKMSYVDYSTGYIRHGYSATSAQDIAKFMRDYYAEDKLTWREI